jgi:hypothetical protein
MNNWKLWLVIATAVYFLALAVLLAVFLSILILT